MSWLKNYLKTQLDYQFISLEGVKIEHKWSERANKFFIDSRAGLLVYKPKSRQDQMRFRNKWINEVEQLRLKEANGTLKPIEIYVLYDELIQAEKVSYQANMNTRLKKKWNSAISRLRIF